MFVLSVVLAAEWGLRPGLGARRPPPAWAVVSPSVKGGLGGLLGEASWRRESGSQRLGGRDGMEAGSSLPGRATYVVRDLPEERV